MMEALSSLQLERYDYNIQMTVKDFIYFCQYNWIISAAFLLVGSVAC